MFIIVQRRLFLENCSNFPALTFINYIINLNADSLHYICIAILQNNLKHYIMIIKIRVPKFRQEKVDKLYSNSLDVSESVDFDFTKVKDVLKIFYPKSNIVEFSII